MLTKLNLGCGTDYREGFINVDWSSAVKNDIQWNLSNFPYPFASNTADEIHMINTLEHIFDSDKAIREVYRILKPDGLFICHVPYTKSDGAFQAIEHKSYYTEKSFDYYCGIFPYPSYTGPTFRLQKVKLTVVNNTLLTRLRNLIPFRNILKHFLWNMYDEVQFEMSKKI